MVRTLVIAALIACSIASHCPAADQSSPWANDIKRQLLSQRPRIEARYTDATRTALVVEAQDYKTTIDLAKTGGHKVSSFKVNVGGKFVEVGAGNGLYLVMTGSDGNAYISLNATSKSRINIYRRGPYYIEVHWLDVELSDKAGKASPIKGEVVFYCYPEKVHVGVILHVTDDMELRDAQVVLDLAAKGFTPVASSVRGGARPSVRPTNGPASACAIMYPVPKGVGAVSAVASGGILRVSNFFFNPISGAAGPTTWAKDSKQTAYIEILPMGSADAESRLKSEMNPIAPDSIKTTEGSSVGYDPIRGCYTVQTDSIGGFNEHFKNPNSYERAAFAIQNDKRPRKVYILHETKANPGSVECGAVLDERGYPLPITVQISKNFRGEFEEKFYNPDDTAFSETIFPLYLAPSERRRMTSLHLYQNWGTHPLKQFSSLGAWMDYYHMSTGVTETTCYVPFNFAGLPGVSIADFRGFSQRFWDSQPQHDNVAGHSFLRYLDAGNVWHYVEYTGTEFRSTGPNWADMSMSYLSDDGKAKVRIDVFELPQTDELRNFIHLRVDFVGDISIKDGDLARNVRILNAATWVQGMRYTHVAYGGAAGDPTVVPIDFNDDFTIAGTPLPNPNGFVVIYPDSRGANAFIVRNSKGKIDGRNASLGFSVLGWNSQGPFHSPGDTILMLVPVTGAKKIRAGDYIEADLFLIPYGGGTETPAPAQKATYDYGVNAPRVTRITRGAKLADFPTRIALDKAGRAEFSITGGFDTIPIIIQGGKDYRNLRLYCLDGGKKTPIDLSQKGMRDGYQLFALPGGVFGSVFLFKTDGKEHRFGVY